MYAPSRDDARRFLIRSWEKFRAGQPLEGLESIAATLVAEHPEYHRLLESGDKGLDRDYAPEAGANNPFLHLSLHLAIAEQLAIDQPPGIKAEFERLRQIRDNEHDALHAILECLGEVLWQSQRTGRPLDADIYLGCLRRQA